MIRQSGAILLLALALAFCIGFSNEQMVGLNYHDDESGLTGLDYQNDDYESGGHEEEWTEDRWTEEIEDLYHVLKWTLIEMGDIAVADNAIIGKEVLYILKGEIRRAYDILTEWEYGNGWDKYRQGPGAGGRNGSRTREAMGGVLAGANNAIGPQRSRLTPPAQERINRKHQEGLAQCGANVCRAAAQRLGPGNHPELKKE